MLASNMPSTEFLRNEFAGLKMITWGDGGRPIVIPKAGSHGYYRRLNRNEFFKKQRQLTCTILCVYDPHIWDIQWDIQQPGFPIFLSYFFFFFFQFSMLVEWK